MDDSEPGRAGVTLAIGGAEVIDELEPLWLSLFDWHAQLGAAQLPTIDRTLSWPRRRALYTDLLAKDGAFVVVARRGTRAIGYALAYVHDGADDTWPTSDRIGEVETLAVVPNERGNGLGTALLDAAEARLAQLGATTVAVAVVIGNADAQRFYERRGMRPTTIRLLRLGSRDRR